MPKKFYVYLHLDPRVKSSFIYGQIRFNYEPFYVGKGCGKRAYAVTGRNPFYTNVIKKCISLDLEPIVKVFSMSSEDTAFEVEKKLIELIGRRDLKLGPLTNLTDGGEGAFRVSKISIAKAKRTRGKWTPEQIKAMKIKRKKTLNNWSKKRWDSIHEKRRQTIANWSEERWELFRKTRKKLFTNRSPEQKKAITDKILYTRSQWTPEQKEAVQIKRKLSFSNWSEEQWESYRSKRKHTYLSMGKIRKEEIKNNQKNTKFCNQGTNVYISVSPDNKISVISGYDIYNQNVSHNNFYRTEHVRTPKKGPAKNWLFINLGHMHPGKPVSKERLETAKETIRLFLQL